MKVLGIIFLGAIIVSTIDFLTGLSFKEEVGFWARIAHTFTYMTFGGIVWKHL